MTVEHTSKILTIWDFNHKDTDDISTPSDTKRFIISQDIADGSGDDQMQDMFRVQASVSPGEGNEDTYDLAGGVTDAFGNTLEFATVKRILIYNTATTAGEDLTVGGPTGGTTGALITDVFDGDNDSRVKIRAGGVLDLWTRLTGYTVTGGSADVLVIKNIGVAAITYQLLIGGTR